MSAAPPAIRRALLARLARTVVALEEDAALARHARENLAARRRGQCRGRDRPATGGWPARRALRRDPARTARPRWCRSGLLRPARGWRPAGRRASGRAPASKAMLYLAGAGQASAVPIFDAAAPALPGFAEPPHSYSDTRGDEFSTGVVWREKRKSRLFHGLPYRPIRPKGFRKAPKALMVNGSGRYGSACRGSGDARALPCGCVGLHGDGGRDDRHGRRGA